MVNSKLNFRKAIIKDLSHLLAIEEKCFKTDRLSKRSFTSFIKNPKDDLIVVQVGEKIVGYGIVLYKKGSSLARLYSIAIDPSQKGKGLGKKLLAVLEESAVKKKAAFMRLEVASKNTAAKSLYMSQGYYQFNVKKDYYENHDSALCFEKILVQLSKRKLRNVQYYQQTTEFTCGAASLMMAMNSLNKKVKINQQLEMKLWREATTIFMLSGHGGCGPRGLALAAKRRGFDVDIYLSTKDFLFLDSVRDPKKKEVMKLVQKDFDDEVKKQKIKIKNKKVSFELVAKLAKEGVVPIVLISSYSLTGTKTPHWIVISGVDDSFLYFHDPYLEEGKSNLENQHIPVRKDEFNRLSKYGSQALQAVVTISR